ncbi:enoyl-[acyl-carrier protein] reductase II [Caloramator quimbayensis]|uniref:Probable nitronate monooxygenase n=1 Tax=Caloramator quimbayensis TaxID=1147123 RepID=A0A1T4XSX4_9CLOT|nr:enoyl-[acyl-carrier-protein] reductase FabK [Caloramator quimbayensis]SKA92248.1 enoyl-[acyl-carrier protein] reductase II [Caloramator quimbayensis]
MKTRVNELLNIEYPIFQGGMAWVSTYELAGAVSNAGGLGIIAAGGAEGEYVRNQIRKIKEITNKPFGVNVMLMSPYVDDVMKVILEEKVPVITTGAGNPGKYIKSLKENGTKIFPVVPSVALAKRMEKEGVDGVIAEGTESGGHIGELTTFCLVPQVVDAVNIPVIAAGGIGDGRGMLAAFALGAEGVQIGTRFVCSTECIVHENYKNAIIEAKDRDAVATGRKTGHPVRCLKNKLTREFEKLEDSNASKEEIEKLGAGALRKAAVLGDIEYGSVMAGQISGLINDIKPCNDIINGLIKEYNENFAKLKEWCK